MGEISMMYRVHFHGPKSTKIEALGKVIIYLDEGDGHGKEVIIPMHKNAESFEFIVPDEYVWRTNSNIMGEPTFNVRIVYGELSQNVNNKKQREEIELVPQKIAILEIKPKRVF